MLPVILCTAFDALQDDLKTIDADSFVVKSIDTTELKTNVKYLLNSRYLKNKNYGVEHAVKSHIDDGTSHD